MLVKLIKELEWREEMKKNISLHGSYYPNNFGDVLILAIQAKWIKEITGREVVLPYATNVYREAINSVSIKGVSGIKASSQLVYGAGGYLGEPPEKKWKWGFNFFRKHVLPAEAAIKNNIEYSIIGPGVGPISNIFTRREIVRICNKAKRLAVRDVESKEYLVKYGVPEEKINVTVDVALSLSHDDLPNKSVTKIERLLSSIKGLIYGLHVGVDMDSTVFGEQAKTLLEETILFINENIEITPVLIIDNNNSTQIKATEYLQKHINRECIIYKYEDIWDTVALLEKLDIVLTNKLHVGIVSYAMGTTCIAVPYHSKTQRFYKQIKRENLCKQLKNLEKGEVYNLLNKTTNTEWLVRLEKERALVFPELQRKSLLNKRILEEFLSET